MSTQSPSSLQQTVAILLRINRQMTSFLELQEPSFSKKDPFMQNGYSPLYQISTETESLVKQLIKRVQDGEKKYQELLQRLQDRLRKHAKVSQLQTQNHCEIKLYCQFLEEELKNEKKTKKQYQSQLESLTVQYNKRIETLKTELSNAMITKINEQRPIDTKRDSVKHTDTLAKIKQRLLNIGNVEINEPISAINTVRDSQRQEINSEPPHPLSQPASFHNSPINAAQKQEVKEQIKTKKVTPNKQKRKSSPKQQLSKGKSTSQSKLKTFKKK